MMLMVMDWLFDEDVCDGVMSGMTKLHHEALCGYCWLRADEWEVCCTA